MSAENFRRLFDGRQVPSKDERDYVRKQQEEPLPDLPAPKRGRINSSLGPPLELMTVEEIIHQVGGKP
jgi:hypothetical protein